MLFRSQDLFNEIVQLLLKNKDSTKKRNSEELRFN